MFVNIILLTLIASSQGFNREGRYVSDESSDTNAMIYGGQDAKPGDNPHMCSLRENGRHACGASIIGDQWVVTAAHCVLKYGTHIVENSTFILHCGTIERSQGGIDYAINISQIIYNKYDWKGPNDIALIKINGKFELGTKYINKIAIAGQDTDVAPGSIVKTIGWGLSSPTTFPEILQTLDVPVVKRDDCQSVYKINPDNFTVDETSICAGGGGREPCSMDSGSPLTFNNTLVGLTSWGKPCGHPGFPTVFTRVAKFRDWIREHTSI